MNLQYMSTGMHIPLDFQRFLLLIIASDTINDDLRISWISPPFQFEGVDVCVQPSCVRYEVKVRAFGIEASNDRVLLHIL